MGKKIFLNQLLTVSPLETFVLICYRQVMLLLGNQLVFVAEGKVLSLVIPSGTPLEINITNGRSSVIFVIDKKGPTRIFSLLY